MVQNLQVQPDLQLRPLLATDQSLLWDIFHVALWDPPPAPLRPREVLDHPHVRIYAENWGLDGDIGVLGMLPDGDGVLQPVGACWMRLSPGAAGLAYVDDLTPQLGIGIFAPYQHKGFGRILMRAALEAARQAGVAQVALTVHPQNPAIHLYLQCGFVHAGMANTFHRMIVRL